MLGTTMQEWRVLLSMLLDQQTYQYNRWVLVLQAHEMQFLGRFHPEVPKFGFSSRCYRGAGH